MWVISKLYLASYDGDVKDHGYLLWLISVINGLKLLNWCHLNDHTCIEAAKRFVNHLQFSKTIFIAVIWLYCIQFPYYLQAQI